MYCAIIGDLVKSKNINPIERNNLQNKLNNLLIKINNDYKNTIAAKFIITLGDEFQGLLSASYSSIEIIEKIIKELHPHNIRFGIGISDIYTDIKPEGAFFADGPAYYCARKAIDTLKNFKNLSYSFAVRYETNDEYDTLLINRTCKLIDVLMNGWTSKQRETVGKMIDLAHQQNKVAENLKVNASTVSRTLQGANYKDYKDSLNDLMIHLQKRYDFATQYNDLSKAHDLNNTGIYLLKQHKYDEALEKLQQALDIRLNKSAREIDVAETYKAIGDVFFAKGNYNNALELYILVLNISEKELILDNPDIANWLISLIDPASFIHPSAVIGRGCVIYPNCFIGAEAVIGESCFLLSGAVINHNCVVGNRVVMATGAHLAGNVKIEDNVYIGQDASVRQFLCVGKNALIGMGAVVIKSVPENAVMGGNPAKLIRMKEK